MAGHSHAKNVAARKGKQDAVRGKLFSKLGVYIMVAAKSGGGDPDTNLRLRYAIDKARSVSMPKEKIERAVLKGTGELEGDIVEETTYEGYGPGGIAIMVEALTDNRARTGGDVRLIFDKNGGNMGLPGCVGYLFDRKGLITIDAKIYPDEDAVMTDAMNAEADDFQNVEGIYEITCEPSKFNALQDALLKAKYELIEADVKAIPKAMLEIDVELGKKLVKIIDKLEENEDVQNVYTTAHLTDEMMG